MKNHIDNL